jgi:hypothetical protein
MFARLSNDVTKNLGKAMQKSKAMVVLGTVVLAVLGGCSMTSPMEEARASAARKVLDGMLQRYEESMRTDNVPGIMDLVDPQLGTSEQERIRQRIELTTWLELYTGYHVDRDRTLNELDTDALNRSFLNVSVYGRNQRGELFLDRMMVRRYESKWYIRDLKLHSPRRGAALDLPRGEDKGIRPTVQALMSAVRRGKAGTVMSILPDTEAAQKRPPQVGFWDRLFGNVRGTYSIGADVERAGKLDFPRWPDVEGQLPLAYVGPAAIMACYDVPYTWPAQEIYNDTLRIEILLTRSEGQWNPKLLRLYGEAIPGTK